MQINSNALHADQQVLLAGLLMALDERQTRFSRSDLVNLNYVKDEWLAEYFLRRLVNIGMIRKSVHANSDSEYELVLDVIDRESSALDLIKGARDKKRRKDLGGIYRDILEVLVADCYRYLFKLVGFERGDQREMSEVGLLLRSLLRKRTLGEIYTLLRYSNGILKSQQAWSPYQRLVNVVREADRYSQHYSEIGRMIRFNYKECRDYEPYLLSHLLMEGYLGLEPGMYPQLRVWPILSKR